MIYKNNYELRKFVAPEIITGLDARLSVGRYIINLGGKKPLIVTDPAVSEQLWFAEILNNIESNDISHEIFHHVSSNPRAKEVMVGTEYFLEKGCDLIVAIGGGSPIDCAKGISVVTSNGGHVLDYEGVDEIRLPGPPLICIPSTAGTAADVSQFAIINDSEHMVKKAIISKKIVPDLALIDPVPLMTMNSHLTACTGMDALTHAIEAYVSNAQSALTDVHALEAIYLLRRFIEDAIQPNRSIETMYQMMLGSLLAGLAFSNASLGAVHAMAHSLGGYLDLPHGECNSILLSHVVEKNYECVPDRYRVISKKMGISTDELDDISLKHKLTEHIARLRERVGIADGFKVGGLTDEMLDRMTQNAMMDPCMVTNPCELTELDVRSIYERVLSC